MMRLAFILLIGCTGGTMSQSQGVDYKTGLFRTRFASQVVDAKRIEVATFAAGCFWGVEEEFRKTKGVVATAVGYTGGHTEKPSYEQVCDGNTGHAEAVRVEFDPAVVTYEQLLELFWSIHDPTTLNRQGPDHGEQYRSAIFFHSELQHQQALASKEKLGKSGELNRPIVTEITAAGAFNLAEGYHQQYVEKGGFAGCHRRKERPI
jgi:peptide-methionine (S)-S-oxide reductase